MALEEYSRITGSWVGGEGRRNSEGEKNGRERRRQSEEKSEEKSEEMSEVFESGGAIRGAGAGSCRSSPLYRPACRGWGAAAAGRHTHSNESLHDGGATDQLGDPGFIVLWLIRSLEDRCVNGNITLRIFLRSLVEHILHNPFRTEIVVFELG